MNVPLLDLRAQYEPIRDEILAAVTRVCDSQHFILGPEVEALERELAVRLQVGHAIGVSSGTDAILVALMALQIGPGDEVITSAYSFFATAGCVARLGATPVLVDIDPATYCIDPAAVEAAMTPQTRVIMPVHLFGGMADMQPLLEIAERRRIAVIEDACQAIGARYHGQPAGAMGTLGCFSFFPSKNLGAFGDGGLVTTNDGALAAEVRLLRNHGAQPKYHHARIGGNFRLDALQAAVLRVKLPHLDRWAAKRRENARSYVRLLGERGLTDSLTLPVEPAGREHVFNQFVVRHPERDALRARLTAEGIGTEVYYPVPLHLQKCFESLGGRPGSCPQAEQAALQSLALPIFAELTDDQQRDVVDAVTTAIAGMPRNVSAAT